MNSDAYSMEITDGKETYQKCKTKDNPGGEKVLTSTDENRIPNEAKALLDDSQ